MVFVKARVLRKNRSSTCKQQNEKSANKSELLIVKEEINMESIADINEQLHKGSKPLFQQQDYVGSSCHCGFF